MNKVMIDYFRDLRAFFNKRDVPATRITELLGRAMPSAVPSGVTIYPYDKRVGKIIARLDMRNLDIIKLISFDHTDHPVGLDEFTKEFGRYNAQYIPDENATMLVCTGFPEEEVIDRVVHRIDGYHFENSEKTA